jgi:dihydrofolate synthase/folylpolyglutamate synthase
MSGHSRPIIFLERTKTFLDALGNPERGLKYIHVTGTAGKGTVTSMVYESLVRAGARVGTFTSPFVVAPTEKIRAFIPGQGDLYISASDFADIVDTMKPHIDTLHRENPQGRPSYFELYLALAFLYFKKKGCEWVVLEVGAGGRFDATNVIEKPLATAITCIDYDHTRLLGRSLKSIAYNKVGIVKKGTTLFTTERRSALLSMFEEECQKIGANYRPLPVSEDYQENNATLARALCEHIGLPERAIQEGIEGVRLPCRFETIENHPLIVLDGAHNRSKIRSTVANLKKLSFEKLHLVVAFKGEKDVTTMLRDIAPHADHIYTTRFQLPTLKCADPNEVARIARVSARKGTQIDVFLDPSDALASARTLAHSRDLILVTGSFYLAGELRRLWYSEEWVIRNRKSFH